jgi:hypothetical protein
MKTSILASVLALRVFDSSREIVTVNGTKTVREGALVFMTEVGGTKSVNLSAKQLDNLAGLAGVNCKGKAGWLSFKSDVGLNRSKALVTIEEYKEGDEFINADKTVGKHTKDGVSVTVDAVILADKVVDRMDAVNAEVKKRWNEFTLPSIESITEPELVGQN